MPRHYAVHLCGTDTPDAGPYRGVPHNMPREVLACPREAEHQYGPSGYTEWHHWADASRKKWKQVKCDCNRYLLIEPKEERRPRAQKKA